jgi:hypothetical protein
MQHEPRVGMATTKRTKASELWSNQYGFPERRVRYCRETSIVDVMDVVLTYTRLEGAARAAVSRMATRAETAAKITWEGTSRARAVMCAGELSRVLKGSRGVVSRRTADIILQISEHTEQGQTPRAIVPVDPCVAQGKRKMEDIEIEKHDIELEKQRKLSELEVKRAKDDAEVGLVKTKFLMMASIGQEERANRLLDTLLH